MSHPKVSVLVLTYNSCEFIAETLESVVNQSYPLIEIVIGDDGSTDNTKKIIEQVEKKYDLRFVKVYSDINQGISKNFNNCLSSCTGEFIFLLGGDDVFLPGKIASQVSFMLENSNVFISYHDVSVFDSYSGKELYKYNSDRHGFFTGDSSLLVRQGTFNCGCATAVRNVNLPFCNEDIKYASDWLWYIQILENNCGEIGYFHGVYARYRRHSKNITSKSLLMHQVKEVLITLKTVIQTYPHLALHARVAEGERLFVYAVKSLLNGDFFGFANLIFMSVASHPFGFFYAFKRKISAKI